MFLGTGNPLSVIQKHIIEDNEERENEYQEFAKLGSDGSRFSTLYFSIWFHIQQDVINLTCAYHQHLFLNLASVSWRMEFYFSHFDKPLMFSVAVPYEHNCYK